MTDPRPWPQRIDGPRFAAVLMGALVGWMIVVGVLGAVVALAVLGMAGEPTDAAHLQAALYRPLLVGPITLIQLLGLGALVVLLARARWPRWTEALALRRPPARALWLSLAVGMSVGPLAGFLAQQLQARFGAGGLFSPEQMLLVARALTEGPLPPRLPLLAAVVLGAPLAEDLAFRGLLWSALSERLPPVAVWITTSLAFAAYHMDPLQSAALLPTALALGWVRLRSRSLVASMAAHFANNLNGVLWMLWLGTDQEQGVGLGLVVASAVGTLALCLLLGRGQEARPNG